MAYYELEANPTYNAANIRKIENSDPVNAETIVNPLVQTLIDNTQAVKIIAEGKADSSHYHNAADINAGILGKARGGTGNVDGYIRTGMRNGSPVGVGTTIEGSNNVSSNWYAHAEGSGNTASGYASHVQNTGCTASGDYSSAGGSGSVAEGFCSDAHGQRCNATANESVAFGYECTVSGADSLACGSKCSCGGGMSAVFGDSTTAAGYAQLVAGRYNRASAEYGDNFIVGNGLSNEVRINLFRVAISGTYVTGVYNTSGADYAEMFEWQDGNPDGEDRAGRFVTLEGGKIRLAGPEDDYLVGIVSGAPSVCGDTYDDHWAGMYLKDVFGRPIFENIDIPEATDPETGNVVNPARTERRMKLNPKYDGAQSYEGRTKRPEWDAVGLLGKLVALDDGSCMENGWATVGPGGIATAAESRTKYRVMRRLDESHVQILIL